MPERYMSLANTSSKYWIRAISAQPLDSGNRAANSVREVAAVVARAAQIVGCAWNSSPN